VCFFFFLHKINDDDDIYIYFAFFHCTFFIFPNHLYIFFYLYIHTQAFSDLTSGSTIWTGKQIAVGVSSQQGLSFLRLYYDPNATNPDTEGSSSPGRIYPHLTAIINVNAGVVTGITWDDGCVFCNRNEYCDEITYNYNGISQTQSTSGQPTGGCYVPKSDCEANAGSSTACDLLLYVVWTGTDVEGRALLSSANRFSVFPTQEIQDRLLNNLPAFSVEIPGI
jgi:hypothetical protein